MANAKKPVKLSTKEILATLAEQTRILNLQIENFQIVINELEERIMDLEDRIHDAKEVVFQDGTGFDW